MIYFLLLTAFTVSIDSFFCGFSLSLSENKKLPTILGVTLTVFVMCAVTNYFAVYISCFLNDKATMYGGIILILIGLYNLFKKDGNERNAKNSVKKSVIVGVAVGIDGAIGNLSLAIMGINGISVPIVIAIFHALFIFLGILLGQSKRIKKLLKFNFVPPLILILLGCYKILESIL